MVGENISDSISVISDVSRDFYGDSVNVGGVLEDFFI